MAGDYCPGLGAVFVVPLVAPPDEVPDSLPELPLLVVVLLGALVPPVVPD